jgi:hypothetical protein
MPFRVDATLIVEGTRRVLSTTKVASQTNDRFSFVLNHELTDLPSQVHHGGRPCPNWTVDFWRSALPIDSYSIKNMSQQDPRGYLIGSLQGI